MPSKNNALRKDAWEIAWPRWMTTATCARYIDRTEAGIRGLVRRGAIPFVKRDGLVYFDRVLIDRWMMAGRKEKVGADDGDQEAQRSMDLRSEDRRKVASGIDGISGGDEGNEGSRWAPRDRD